MYRLSTFTLYIIKSLFVPIIFLYVFSSSINPHITVGHARFFFKIKVSLDTSVSVLVGKFPFGNRFFFY